MAFQTSTNFRKKKKKTQIFTIFNRTEKNKIKQGFGHLCFESYLYTYLLHLVFGLGKNRTCQYYSGKPYWLSQKMTQNRTKKNTKLNISNQKGYYINFFCWFFFITVFDMLLCTIFARICWDRIFQCTAVRLMLYAPLSGGFASIRRQAALRSEGSYIYNIMIIN